MDEQEVVPLRCERCGAEAARLVDNVWLCDGLLGGCNRPTVVKGEVHNDPALERVIGANGTGPINTRISEAGNLLPDGFPATDLGNAHRFVEQAGELVRHTAAQGWLHWTGARWKQDDMGFLITLAKDTVRVMVNYGGEVLQLYKGDNAHSQEVRQALKLIKYAGESQSARKLKSMLELASSERGIVMRPDDFDSEPMLFNCANCTIELPTGEARVHEKTDYLTKKCPTHYDPDAKAPAWDKFLLDVFQTPELVSYVQRVVGYCMTGDATERAVFVHYGTGSNGKSTFLNTITDVLGEDYCARIGSGTITGMAKDGPSPEIARLRGKRLASCIEMGDGRRLNEEVIKSLSGGAREKISARYLFNNHVMEFAPEFKLHMAVNHRPEIRGQDLGIWSRIRLIPYTRTFSDQERDLGLVARLRLEASGILAWAVRGAIEWRQRGLVTPDVVKIATMEYREEMDGLADFLGMTHEYSGATVGAGELYQVYRDWAEKRGDKPLNQNSLGRRLTERGLKSGKERGVRVWHGLSLVPQPRTVDSDWTT